MKGGLLIKFESLQLCITNKFCLISLGPKFYIFINSIIFSIGYKLLLLLLLCQ